MCSSRKDGAKKLCSYNSGPWAKTFIMTEFTYLCVYVVMLIKLLQIIAGLAIFIMPYRPKEIQFFRMLSSL